MEDNLRQFLQLTYDQAFAKLNSSRQGLSAEESKQRQNRIGYNEIAQKIQRNPFTEAVSHAFNPLVGILLLAAIISAFSRNIINASIVVTVVVISVMLDYFQTHRSLKAAQALQEQVAATATVLRDGEWVELLSREIVPGDIIRLEAGDLVPADSILVEAKDLHVQQAALTGESLPVEKEAIHIKNPPQNLAEASNAVFFGSSVISGTASALVFATGNNTEFGEIAKSLTTSPPRTEFENGILRFGMFIMKTVFFLVLYAFVVNVIIRHDPLGSLMFAVALAVGLTPEFLPMITTVTLATGAVRMAHKKVIVKTLSAIQNFGSMDILCSDKTGTLTRGEMILEGYLDPFGKQSEYVLLLAYLNSLFETGIKNPLTTAVLKRTHINPLDIAILKHDHPDTQSYVKIDEIPFDSERRRASVVVGKGDTYLLITKGAPEQTMKICSTYEANNQCLPLTPQIITQCQTLFRELSGQGYRVIAVAYRTMPTQAAYHIQDETELTLAGFLTFFDPPLEDAAETIAALQKAGVEIKILTGDNDLVTRHVCQEVGFDPGHILLGEEIDHMSSPALAHAALQTQVFARVTPLQKQRIILALRSRGHVVGYIGDGINDAPSLHSADVGISVSGAVDVAREAAEIILLENHLKVLLSGIIEGRKSFGNVMKYLMMGTSSNFGNMLSMALAVVFLPFLPMLPSQILLNNLLYDFAQVTIPTDHVDPSFIQKPRHWNIDIIRRFMFYIGPISSIFDFLTFYVMLNIFHAGEALFQTGWFVESLATQSLVILLSAPLKIHFIAALVCH